MRPGLGVGRLWRARPSDPPGFLGASPDREAPARSALGQRPAFSARAPARRFRLGAAARFVPLGRPELRRARRGANIAASVHRWVARARGRSHPTDTRRTALVRISEPLPRGGACSESSRDRVMTSGSLRPTPGSQSDPGNEERAPTSSVDALSYMNPALTYFRLTTIIGPCCLTAVFGMGTGVSNRVWAPEICLLFSQVPHAGAWEKGKWV